MLPPMGGQRVHRWVAALTAATMTLVSVGATAAPAQEDLSGESDATEQALVDIEVSAAEGDLADIAGALGDLAGNVEAQLGQLESAQANVMSALAVLTDREAAVAETEARIEAIVGDSDEVVIRTFMNPPFDNAVDLVSETSVSDATIRKAVLDMQADRDAAVLAGYEKERAQLVVDKEAKEAALEDAEVAKADAEDALADLEAAVSQHT
jgi:predicted  nucleic acid-binding Zn-ribbon protein